MKPLSYLLVLALLLLVPCQAQADGGRTVTMKMQDLDVVAAIQTIAKVGGANVIVSPKVRGTISLSFVDTPWLSALETVAQATGNRVVKQEFGIYLVMPEKEARAYLDSADKKKFEKEAAKMKAAQKQTDDLTARLKGVSVRLDEAKKARDLDAIARHTHELSELTRRIASLRRPGTDKPERTAEAEDTRKKVVKLLAESVNRARALEDALLADKRSKEQAFYGGEARTLQIFDVRDLQKAGHKLEGVARKAVGHDGTVTLKGGMLIVQSKAAGIERLVAKLTELRAGSPFASRLLRGRVAADNDYKPAIVTKIVKGKKKVTAPYTVTFEGEVIGPDGEPKVRAVLVDRAAGKRRASWPETDHDRTVQQRIEQLQQAGKLLKAAGDREGSERAFARASELQTNLENRRRSREALAQRRVALGIEQRSDTGTLRAIQTLRKDVNALRSEVRELTALVRKLLHERR